MGGTRSTAYRVGHREVNEADDPREGDDDARENRRESHEEGLCQACGNPDGGGLVFPEGKEIELPRAGEERCQAKDEKEGHRGQGCPSYNFV